MSSIPSRASDITQAQARTLASALQELAKLDFSKLGAALGSDDAAAVIDVNVCCSNCVSVSADSVIAAAVVN